MWRRSDERGKQTKERLIDVTEGKVSGEQGRFRKGIVIVMWGGKCTRQQRPYGTIGVVGLGSRVG